MTDKRKAPVKTNNKGLNCSDKQQNKTTKKSSFTPKNNDLDNVYRVGNNYYKDIAIPLPNGTKIIKRTSMNRQTVIDDFTKYALPGIKKYSGFVNIPEHLQYQREIDNFINLYLPISIQPNRGEWKTIETFLRHVFGNQYEFGLDYFQNLFFNPTQLLPILCLVSKENQTGKTTFGTLLSVIFGDNFTVIGNSEFTEKYNSSYAYKLVCMVDESHIQKNTLDKLKMLSTSETIQHRQMRADHVEIPFFCKFILCSNNEDSFIDANSYDIRYWVRKLNRIESFDPDYKAKLQKEAPAFIHFLQTRHLSASKSRMYFLPEDILTEQLERIRKVSVDANVKSVLYSLSDYISRKNCSKSKVFYFSHSCINTIVPNLKQAVSLPDLDRVLECFKSPETERKQRRKDFMTGISNARCIGVSLEMIDKVLE